MKSLGDASGVGAWLRLSSLHLSIVPPMHSSPLSLNGGEVSRPLPPLLKVFPSVCLAKAHALSTTFPLPPSSSIYPLVHSVSVPLFTVDTTGRIRAAFANLLIFSVNQEASKLSKSTFVVCFPWSLYVTQRKTKPPD